MKEGAIIGAVAAFFVFSFLPIYDSAGTEASLIPTANVVKSEGFVGYVKNLPFSMVISMSLEVIGVSVGILSQMILSRKTNNRFG